MEGLGLFMPTPETVRVGVGVWVGLAIISPPSSLLPEDEEASFLYEMDPLKPMVGVVLFGVGPAPWLDALASLLDRPGRPRPIVP